MRFKMVGLHLGVILIGHVNRNDNAKLVGKLLGNPLGIFDVELLIYLAGQIGFFKISKLVGENVPIASNTLGLIGGVIGVAIVWVVHSLILSSQEEG